MKQKTLTVEKRTVLFVDDDEIFLQSIERDFLDEPYNILFAKSGKEAFEILQREQVHVIVTDMRMPEMTGLELLETIIKMYPHIVSIVMSGYTETLTLQIAVTQEEIFRFISKPWYLKGGFKKVLREAIDHYNLQSERDTVRRQN